MTNCLLSINHLKVSVEEDASKKFLVNDVSGSIGTPEATFGEGVLKECCEMDSVRAALDVVVGRVWDGMEIEYRPSPFDVAQRRGDCVVATKMFGEEIDCFLIRFS